MRYCPPSILQACERIVVLNALAVTKLILSWVSVTGVSQYLVQYRFNNTNWVSQVVFRPDFELFNSEAGTYEFKVYSYNAALVLSATSSDLVVGTGDFTAECWFKYFSGETLEQYEKRISQLEHIKESKGVEIKTTIELNLISLVVVDIFTCNNGPN